MTDEATAAGRPRPRRLFVLIAVLALALTVTAVVVVTDRRSQDEAALTTPPPAAPAADARRPNIILVTTDDMSLSDLQWMPNTRRLIGEVGARVDPFLSNHPLCCPARAQILTGQQAQNSGVFDNSGRYGGFPRLKQPNNHIGAWLKDAGYQTAFIGKFLNLWERRPVQQKGWSIFNPSSEGVYSAYDITMWNDGNPRRYADVHTGDLMGQLTVETIEQFAADGAPFFIWTSQLPPHGMRVDGKWTFPVPAERHRDAFPDALPPSWGEPVFFEEDVSDKPAWVRQARRPTPEKMIGLNRTRIQSLLSVDDQIKSMLQTLRDTGQLANTYVFFTSDNGFAVGEHGLTTKNHPYETSLQVPLLVRGPGIEPGSRCPGQFGMADLAPTFLDIADADAGRPQDGRSMLPALFDGAPGYSHYPIQASGWSYEPGLKWWWRGVRSEQFTYVRYHDQFEELYDLEQDPTQLQNVATDPRYADVLAEYSERLDGLTDCAAATCWDGGSNDATALAAEGR